MIIGKYKDPPNRYRGSCLLSLLLPILIAANAWASGGSLFDVDSAQVSSTLENYFRQAQDAVSNHDVRLARQQLSLISFKIEKYGNLIAKNDKKIYDSRVSTLKTSIKSTIDSLVLVNLSIIRTKGQAAGIEFRQKCTASGLSEIELAQVDEAIVNATSEEAPKASQYVEPSPPPRPRRRNQGNGKVFRRFLKKTPPLQGPKRPSYQPRPFKLRSLPRKKILFCNRRPLLLNSSPHRPRLSRLNCRAGRLTQRPPPRNNPPRGPIMGGPWPRRMPRRCSA